MSEKPTIDGVSRLDRECWETLQTAPHTAVAWWLMAAYTYYHLDRPILSDALFDHIGQTMLAHWSFIQHRHKALIHPSDLVAGSLYRLRAEDFPTITKDTALMLMEKCDGRL